MRIANNNQEIINKLTNRSLQKNKVRNIFTILAIVLTTFMISSIFSLGVSFIINNSIKDTRYAGTTANVSIKNPTLSQLEKIKNSKIFKTSGTEINVGEVSLEKLEENKRKVVLEYYDNDNYENQIKPAITDINGKYPESQNEIMISRLGLQYLGQPNAQVGDKIELPCKINNKVENNEFIISGIFTNYEIMKRYGCILVSQKFTLDKNMTVEENGSVLMNLKNSYKSDSNNILSREITLNDGQEFHYLKNFEEEASDVENVATLMLIIICFIVVSGYLLIYNVFYISVTKDINFYGLLKTIGTSPKQIKKIVRNQALKLSVIGIPMGLILGVIVSFVILPTTMENFYDGIEAMPKDISFHPIIFIGATVFSLMTIIISCRKPEKIAGNISPVEALRYTGNKEKSKKLNRKTTNGGKLYKMAWYNVFRDKKKAILVFLSLFMGIITFLTINTFLDGIKIENYIKRYARNDFELTNIDMEDVGMNDDVIESIKNMNGIKDISLYKSSDLRLNINDEVLSESIKNGYDEYKESDEKFNEFVENTKNNPEMLSTSVMGLDDKAIEKVYEENNGKFDLNAFKQGDLILISMWHSYENYKDISGNLTITNPKTNHSENYNAKTFDFKYSLPYGKVYSVGLPFIYMSTNALERLDKNPINYICNINVDEKYEASINSSLEKIVKEHDLEMKSKSDMVEGFTKENMVLNVLGQGASIILIIIGLLNFVNVMITGVNQRLKELAVMESIGMTKNQIKKMLEFEGIYYAFITILLICTLGIAIVFKISKITQAIADYAVFSIPVIPILFLTIAIFTICIITPIVVFKTFCNQSVTERLRIAE